MDRFKGVLVVSDYDGTLVPSHKRITDKVRGAVRRFNSEGGFFTVCTGRTYQGFHAYSPDIVNAPVVLSNGGMAYDYLNKTIVFQDAIGVEAAEAFRNIRDLFPFLSIELYAFNDTYAIHPHEKADRHFTSQNIPYKIIEDPCEAAYPWSKVMLGGEPGQIAAVQDYISLHHQSISYIPTTGGYLEVLKPGINKGTALLKLASFLGISRDHIYAIGDGYNDVDMLRAAAAAFVPANGDEQSKAAATYIVSSNEEDAAADVIDMLSEKYT